MIIYRYTNTTVMSMHQVVSEVKSGLQIVEKTGDIFDQIYTSINSVAEQIKQISSSAGDVSAFTKEVEVSFVKMEEFTRKTTSNINDVAQSSEGQLMSVNNVYNLANELNKITWDLQEQIEKLEELK